MEDTMLSPDRISELKSSTAASTDYDIVRRAIAHIRGNWRTQPEIIPEEKTSTEPMGAARRVRSSRASIRR